MTSISLRSLKAIIVTSGFLCVSFFAHAQTNNDFFTPVKSSVQQLPVSPSEYQDILKVMNGNLHLSCQESNLSNIFDTGSASPLAPYVETAKDLNEIVDEGNEIVDGLINIGQKIWAIIKAGRPVVNINIGPSANALPKGVKCWDELEKWQVPSVFRGLAQIENIYGFTLAEFQFDVIFTHGGSFNGKGQYLTHVQVFPSNVYAFWMQELNASVSIPSLVNRGTTANPIAGMQVDISWQFKNFLNEVQQSASVFVQGDGTSKSLNGFSY